MIHIQEIVLCGVVKMFYGSLLLIIESELCLAQTTLVMFLIHNPKKKNAYDLLTHLQLEIILEFGHAYQIDTQSGLLQLYRE